ncbi:MAG TPA: winged helix-turn-helix transcriptional regulator [Symbiobacteriaceae bacterium]|nr:winged helix-turn-helix transcriptional regulator [Symbiobacteriaceae bacterium]
MVSYYRQLAKRFSEIEPALPISGRVLSERLRELEEEGLVLRLGRWAEDWG